MNNGYEKLDIFSLPGMKFRISNRKTVVYSLLLLISVFTILIIYRKCLTNVERNSVINTELPFEYAKSFLRKPFVPSVTSTTIHVPRDVTSPKHLEVKDQNASNLSIDSYSNVAEMIGPYIDMADRKLIAKLRDEYLLSPPANVSLNLTNPWLYDTSMGQSLMIRKILGYKRNGFFIECGALDGETRSNSLVFERLYNWTGLLIEADPLNYEEAVYKRRRAYLSQTCLSVKPYPIVVSFEQARNMGKISDRPLGYSGAGHVDVLCFPLYTYLLAMNRTTVDYFSLDVEGSELEVLETIPFDKLDIRTLSVEFIHGSRGKDALREFMEGKGYSVYGEVTHYDYLANDFIFVKEAPTAQPTR